MAELLEDGSIRMRNGRILWGRDLVQIIDVCELSELLVPPPKVVGGFQGFGGGGGRGPAGPAGSPGIQGPPGIISLVQDEGFNLPLQNTLNFIGESVSVTDDPGFGRLNITIRDLFASARIVSSNPAEGTDLTIQDAIDNLPGGGDIYVKPGTYIMPAALTSQPAPITIHGAGIDVTILDFGAVAGKFISIDHDAPINLKNLTVWAGGAAGQYLYDVSTNYLGTEIFEIDNVYVGKSTDATKSIEGVFLGPIFAQVTNLTAILQTTAASYFADSGALTPGLAFILCYNVTAVGTGAQRLKWGGFKNQVGLEACESSTFGCANFGALGFTVSYGGTGFVGGGTTSALTVTAFSQIGSGTYINDAALVLDSFCNVTGLITGPLYSAWDRIIDIPSGATNITITGCVMSGWTVETIRNEGTYVRVSNCVTNAGGSEITVTEVGAANFNSYWDIGAGRTIVGANSLVNNENVITVALDTLLTGHSRTVSVNAAGAPRTITLPPAASVKFIVYTIKKVDATANVVTIDANGGELIDGVLTQLLVAQWQSVTIQSDGTQWLII